jgi:hypothetical protein
MTLGVLTTSEFLATFTRSWDLETWNLHVWIMSFRISSWGNLLIQSKSTGTYWRLAPRFLLVIIDSSRAGQHSQHRHLAKRRLAQLCAEWCRGWRMVG